MGASTGYLGVGWDPNGYAGPIAAAGYPGGYVDVVVRERKPAGRCGRCRGRAPSTLRVLVQGLVSREVGAGIVEVTFRAPCILLHPLRALTTRRQAAAPSSLGASAGST